MLLFHLEPKVMLNIMKSFPDNEKPLVRCKRPMCDDLECPKGYQLDSRGCETCNCLTSQCEVSVKCNLLMLFNMPIN